MDRTEQPPTNERRCHAPERRGFGRMSNPTTIEGVFDPVDLWQTKNGEIFTNKQLAEYRAHKDGDSDPMSGGYPIGPSHVGLGYRRRSDGAVFIIRQVDRLGDERSRASIVDEQRYLNSIKL